MAFRIAERAHGAFQTPAVSEVMVHRGPFLLVRVPPVPFPASGLSSGAFLLEAFPVPHRQHPPAGIAELVYHVRGAALVSDVQVHGPVTLLLAVLRHKGVLLPVGKSKKTSPPRFLHYFSAVWAAGFHQELHHMTAQTRTGTSPPCLYIPETQPKNESAGCSRRRSGRKGRWRYRCPNSKISGDWTVRECPGRRSRGG